MFYSPLRYPGGAEIAIGLLEKGITVWIKE